MSRRKYRYADRLECDPPGSISHPIKKFTRLIPQFAPEPPLRHNLVPLPVFPVELAPFPSARRIVYLKELRCTSVPSCAARSTALWRSRACRHFVRYAVMPVVKKNAVADLRRDAGRECAVPHYRIQK